MTATIPKGFHPEPFSYHQELELDIDALSNAGDGIGRVDGWVVFVPFALPGDRVKARVWRNDKNYSSADLVEVLHPSPDRVEPGCRLFGTCGGCQYQHFSYDRQLLWKTRQVAGPAPVAGRAGTARQSGHCLPPPIPLPLQDYAPF